MKSKSPFKILGQFKTIYGALNSMLEEQLRRFELHARNSFSALNFRLTRVRAKKGADPRGTVPLMIIVYSAQNFKGTNCRVL